MNYTEGGVVVLNGSEPSSVSELKDEQDQALIQIEFKASVHKHKMMAFEEGGDCVLIYQRKLCVQMVDD